MAKKRMMRWKRSSGFARGFTVFLALAGLVALREQHEAFGTKVAAWLILSTPLMFQLFTTVPAQPPGRAGQTGGGKPLKAFLKVLLHLTGAGLLAASRIRFDDHEHDRDRRDRYK